MLPLSTFQSVYQTSGQMELSQGRRELVSNSHIFDSTHPPIVRCENPAEILAENPGIPLLPL